jgi:hypothetical protein
VWYRKKPALGAARVIDAFPDGDSISRQRPSMALNAWLRLSMVVLRLRIVLT